MKVQIKIARATGVVTVMDEEFESIPGAKAEITDAAEGLIWVDVEVPE